MKPSLTLEAKAESQSSQSRTSINFSTEQKKGAEKGHPYSQLINLYSRKRTSIFSVDKFMDILFSLFKGVLFFLYFFLFFFLANRSAQTCICRSIGKGRERLVLTRLVVRLVRFEVIYDFLIEARSQKFVHSSRVCRCIKVEHQLIELLLTLCWHIDNWKTM